MAISAVSTVNSRHSQGDRVQRKTHAETCKGCHKRDVAKTQESSNALFSTNELLREKC